MWSQFWTLAGAIGWQSQRIIQWAVHHSLRETETQNYQVCKKPRPPDTDHPAGASLMRLRLKAQQSETCGLTLASCRESLYCDQASLTIPVDENLVQEWLCMSVCAPLPHQLHRQIET